MRDSFRALVGATNIVFIACMAALAAPVQAQTAGDPVPAPAPQPALAPGLEEVVVTAQRRAQRLQDVPVAVSVVSGVSLQRANLTTLEDVSERLPDVKITSGPLVDQINIRGVGSGQNAGFEQSVATFVDGVYRARSRAVRAALFDIDQVEVLKGPQTTFFGNNAIAGALNITTRKPGDHFEYNASTLYAFEDGEYNTEAGVTVPVTDGLSVRLAGRVSGMDGYIDNRTTHSYGPHANDRLGRVSLRWEPDSAFRSDLRFDYGRFRTSNALSAELVNCPPAAPFTLAPGNTCAAFLAANGGKVDARFDYRSDSPYTFLNYEFSEAAWTNTWNVGQFALTATTGEFHHNYSDLVQLIPTPVPGVAGYDQLPARLYENFNQFSQEIRLQSPTGGTLEYMVGGYFAHSKSDLDNTAGFYFLPFGAFTPFTTPDTPVTGRPQLDETDRTLSAFASATIRPFEGFRLNLGGRFTNVRKDAERHVSFGTSVDGARSTYVELPAAAQPIFAGIIGADLGPFPNPVRTDSEFMPAAGVQYDLTGNVMTYATYSRGFKAGGFSAASLADEFGPETVNAYEVGLKGSFFEHRLVLNSDVFLSDYKGLQESTVVFASSGTIVSLIRNAAASRSQGVEAGASLQLLNNLVINTDLSYLDSKYTDYPNGACTMLGNLVPNCVQDMSGKRRAYAPTWSGNLGAELTVPIAGYQLRASPTVYFSSWFFESATADPLLEQSGYAKIDFRLGFGPASERWEVAVVGKNLTNKATAGFRDPITLAPGSVYVLPDRPRSIGLQFSVKN
jgi:outer membrane receptor protein involved in Fe transport